MKDLRESGQFKCAALDETAINAHHTYPKEWLSNDGTVGRLIPTGRGKRLVLLHAIHEDRRQELRDRNIPFDEGLLKPKTVFC